ncbi:L-threonylcarbamoyladenylate synthase [Amphiplicatus metriothermophilus]|uniref:Threonylcarbamoyl-AMP synthase n=1 Tax=Amphiplicatus metriothermophilus TaxID=1519374 RepID=A0A239PJR0_9PROT|nr:L-threonylcarbamoyladenylate synthase [Amphiplicatus metriothermophilus]MBB5518103.1 L-threonylcarbamoyladenylate synthase [Amphiplicatus metriothermophilus]SNT67563.1 translation factor SUA5 [Amphiplicatus metriothermophilus]
MSEIVEALTAAQTARAARRAGEILRAGGLVGLPTETVYGLAADATNDRAVARVFEAKGRPAFNPLIAHVRDLDMAKAHAVFSPLAERLARAFWPGPLTLVLPRRADSGVSLLATAGLDTIALRAPAHPAARAAIEAADRPLAAPSANPSGAVSPTTAAHVAEGLGDRADLILDGGPCPVGIESTIVKVEGEDLVLLRPGGVARAAIEAVAGRPLRRAAGAVEAPGMLASHYAPAARLRLDVETPRADEAFLAFGAPPGDHPHTFLLSEAGDAVEAAANLFAMLRAADALCREKALKGIAVAPIPASGLGEAINDRLARAAAPREGSGIGD